MSGRIYPNVVLGEGVQIQDNVIIGAPARQAKDQKEEMWPKTIIGPQGLIRSGTVIYCDVIAGSGFETGHQAVIREGTRIGERVLVGTQAVIEGNVTIGSRVRIQSHAFIPPGTAIGDDVFIGPHVVLTNDKYPARITRPFTGPQIRSHASIGANAVILPGIEVGEGALIAAGSVVTRDVPPWTLAKGNPARMEKLPDHLKTGNRL